MGVCVGGGPIIEVTTTGHTHSDSWLVGLVWRQGVWLVGDKGSARRVLGGEREEREGGMVSCRTKGPPHQNAITSCQTM